MTATKPYIRLTAHVEAPARTVFDYCRDPRNIHDGDPITVVDAHVTKRGVGTTARLTSPVPFPLDADVRFEYTEVVPYRRIVFTAVPTMWMRGHHRPHHEFKPDTFIWTFDEEDEGTRLTVEVTIEKETLPDRLSRKSMEDRIRARIDRVKAHIEHGLAA